MRVQPVPVLKGNGPRRSASLRSMPRAGRKTSAPVKTADVRTIEYYEAMVVADAENLVKQMGETPAALDQLGAAEKLLAAALRFHEYARERSYPDRKIPIRSGKGWDELRTSLTGKLRTVRLDYLRAALAAKDNAADTRTQHAPHERLPKGCRRSRRRSRSPGSARSNGSSSPANHPDNVRAKELLDELEAKYPGAGGDSARKLRGQLRDLAQKAFERARQKKAVGDLNSARDELVRAAALDPTIDGVREMQRELRTGYPILNVGVRQFPAHMSPATARLDSERQAVELLFEGLLEEIPDESGAIRYRPGVAVAMPTVIPGGRDFLLRTFEREASRPARIRQPRSHRHREAPARTQHDSWPAYPTGLARSGPARPRDAGSVRLGFAVGHPDPRALLTFKLLPTRWLEDERQVARRRRVRGEALRDRPLQAPGPHELRAGARAR